MTLIIDVPPDVVRALEERAERSGQSVAEFAAALLAQAAGFDRASGSIEQQGALAGRLAALKRIGAYDTRTEAGLPPLSDQAVSRESIYEGRGL